MNAQLKRLYRCAQASTPPSPSSASLSGHQPNPNPLLQTLARHAQALAPPSPGSGAEGGDSTGHTRDPLAGFATPLDPVETGPGDVRETEAADRALRLPTLRQLLQGAEFELRGEELGWERLGEGLSVWGGGAFTDVEGDPVLRGQRLDYEGEIYGLFLGADQRVEIGAPGAGRELVAGAALGFSRGNLDYRDRAPVSDFETAGRFESELWTLYPYASLQFWPRAQLWLMAGYGWGDVEIEEQDRVQGRDGSLRRVEADATMWMVSAGVEGSAPLPGLGEGSEVTMRVFGTRTGGELRRARFDDPERSRLRGTRARTWRAAGELEASYRFAFGEGASFRPFATARLRGEAGDDLGDDWELAVDLGGGAALIWPTRGLSLELRGTAQMNDSQRNDRVSRREHRVAVDLRYDLGGDGQGLTVAVESALEGSARLGEALRRGDAAGDPLAGSSLQALWPVGADGLRAAEEDAEQGLELRPTWRAELGYGLLAALPGAGRGLLTPYARLDWAARGRGYAAGLRFDAFGGAQFGLEAGVDFLRSHAGATDRIPPDYRFLLTGELEF